MKKIMIICCAGLLVLTLTNIGFAEKDEGVVEGNEEVYTNKVRVIATSRANWIGISEVELFNSQGENVALHKEVTPLVHESQKYCIERGLVASNLTDGTMANAYPGGFRCDYVIDLEGSHDITYARITWGWYGSTHGPYTYITEWHLQAYINGEWKDIASGGEPGEEITTVKVKIQECDDYTGVITIVKGWNLIALPVLPEEPYSVRRFIKDVELFCEDWKVKVVAVYKNGRFHRYPKKGITYNIIPGEAYFVYTEYDGEWPLSWHWLPRKKVFISGRPLNVPVSLNLNRGWSGVSIPLKEGFSCSSDRGLLKLSKELIEQGIKATKIAFWSQGNQEWEEYVLPYELVMPDGNSAPFGCFPSPLEQDRLINADEGFFLLCDENGLFIPGLGLLSELPVPPKPPITLYDSNGNLILDLP